MTMLLNILVILVSMILGLVYSFYFWWFAFSPLICLFAAIFLIMPSFFNFQLSDFKSILKYKKIVWLNLLINFLVLPIIALFFWFFISDKGIIAAIFLLSLLPWGGMMMHWIKKSWWNTKLWLKLFIINLLMIVPAMFVFFNFEVISSNLWIESIFKNDTETLEFHWTCPLTGHLESVCEMNSWLNPKAFGPFIILVLIPFLISRAILKFSKSLVSFSERHKEKISLTAISLIVFYLLWLSSSSAIFQATTTTLVIAFFACLVFYLMSVFISFLVLRKNDKDFIALFWNISTKYITFWMALATFFVSNYWGSFVLVFVFAYFIQILTSFALSSILNMDKR